MANSNLTIDMITNEALDVLHQKLTFIRGVNRQYDSSFAKTGAKIGDTLRIRLPNEYTVRTGRTINVQDSTESKVDLTVATQKGVDVEFTSEELALDIDNFRERILEPQMAVLAAAVEFDALSNMTKEVYNVVDDDAAAFDFHTALQAGAVLTKNLAPLSQRTMLLSPDAMVKVVDSNKSLFNDPAKLSQAYREGLIGKDVAGFDWANSTHVLDHTTGTAAKTTGYLVNGASQTGASVTVDGGTTTFLEGDVITIAGVNRVHPETKEDTGELQKFVVTADSGASATSIAVSPSITITGGKQNVSGAPADNSAIVKVGAGASEKLNGNLGYHRDAFAFVTADLRLPGGQTEAYRANFDGLSLRFVQGYDITNDTFPSRFDILYGYKAVRPQLAVRTHADG